MPVGFPLGNIMDDEKINITMDVGVPADNKKQVYLKLDGLDRGTVFDFSSEEDAETASRLGANIMNCIEKLFVLGAELDTEEENPSIQLSAN